MRTLSWQALAWVLAAALAGCVVEAPYPAQPVDSTAPAPATDETEEQAPEPPPPLPVYEQPPPPVEGYIWTPGLWRWGVEGYYWVPGTWVAPPQVGFLWTPGYWALVGAVYLFHPGHWGPHVGYYGGINYGHGYDGEGFHGGRWVNNRFQYNTAVTNVNVTTVHNVYHETVVHNVAVNNPRVSYAGGPGTRAQPNPAEAAHASEPRFKATPVQFQHHVDARAEPTLNAARNEGRPQIAGTPRPSAFRAPGVTAAKPVGEPYHPQRPLQRDEKPKEDRH
ncbi:MAG TPA: YXWGXW repeat-containing protein [Steroidobacteraceae bacterium]|nr:YXWGXW repeat-containing protein [Steroidobacteraceae bacterium]